jgi:LCP family protein required for cell wall assembly
MPADPGEQVAAAPPPRTRTARPARPARPTRRRRFPIGRLLLVLVLVIAAFGVYVDFSLNRVSALPADSKAATAGTNWLIVGSDSRSQLTDEQRDQLATGNETSELTDTIMILHTGSGPSTLVSLPRDSMVDIPGHGREKINSAYGRGGGANGGGPELLVRTVEGATGLKIDHYVEIGFLGVVSVVDAVGGVYMCVPESIKDPKAALDIEEGCQTLDEATALGYVRTRATAGSDFDRVERQRAFLSALVKKATSPATLVNPFRVVPLTSAVTAAITVDESDHVWNLAGLGFAMRGISSGEGVTTTVPIGGTPTIGGQSVVQWDKTRAAALFTALENDQKPTGRALGP